MRWDTSVGLSLSSAEVPSGRERLAAELRRADDPDVHVAAGLLDYLLADFAAAEGHLRTAFLRYQESGNRRRAALTAAHLGRVEHDGKGRVSVANGWFSRAHRLAASEPRCVEQGWVALNRVGCSFTDADELERRARDALALAGETGDVDLECRALGEIGLALVGHGQTTEGMTLLDEAMTMVDSGECGNAFISAQVLCCIVSACERSGDLTRMEALLDALRVEQPAIFRSDARPGLLLVHCESEYGSLLCGAGRWREAETALRRAVHAGESAHHLPRMRAHAALADLRVSQGRLPEAASALAGYEDRTEAQFPLARLHLARGDADLAAAVARRGVRALSGDVARSAPLLATLVEAELARGETGAAQQAAADLAQAAERSDRAQVRALAALTQARVAIAVGNPAAGLRAIETGLAALKEDAWPLVAADLRLELAFLLQHDDRVAALAEARAALTAYSRAGSRRMHEAQALLHSLGDVVVPAEPGAVGRLTAREREVLRLLADGATNPDIARMLVISAKTAEHHVSNILRKLQLTGRSEAAVYAATLAGR